MNEFTFCNRLLLKAILILYVLAMALSKQVLYDTPQVSAWQTASSSQCFHIPATAQLVAPWTALFFEPSIDQTHCKLQCCHALIKLQTLA